MANAPPPALLVCSLNTNCKWSSGSSVADQKKVRDSNGLISTSRIKKSCKPPETSTSRSRQKLPKRSHISHHSGGPSLITTAQTLVPAHTALSPIASLSSSASCIPKSSSSTGPISGNWPLDYEILQHPEKGSIQCLADIDGKLEAINE